MDALEVWKTITLSGNKTVDDLWCAMNDADITICTSTDEIFDDLRIQRGRKTEVDLVLLPTWIITNEEESETREVLWGAKHMDLRFCPPKLGPELRVQCLDQPLGEEIYIGMEPIRANGDDFVFFMGNDDIDGLFFSARGCDNKKFGLWKANDLWVFILPRKKSGRRGLGFIPDLIP